MFGKPMTGMSFGFANISRFASTTSVLVNYARHKVRMKFVFKIENGTKPRGRFEDHNDFTTWEISFSQRFQFLLDLT